MFPPHFTKSSGIGHRRKHSALSSIPRNTVNVADNRSMTTSLMVARLNMNADYQSSDPINQSRQQISVAFSNNANQMRNGSDETIAQNRRPLLRKR